MFSFQQRCICLTVLLIAYQDFLIIGMNSGCFSAFIQHSECEYNIKDSTQVKDGYVIKPIVALVNIKFLQEHISNIVVEELLPSTNSRSAFSQKIKNPIIPLGLPQQS